MPAECAVAVIDPRRPWAASSSGRAPALQAGGARFESAVVHVFGIEEDGNLPDSDSGETRFDSGGPDHGSLAEKD